MDKIQILTTCATCQGKTYLTKKNENGHHTCQPCPTCHGSGTQLEWIELRELARLLYEIRNGSSPHKGVL